MYSLEVKIKNNFVQHQWKWKEGRKHLKLVFFSHFKKQQNKANNLCLLKQFLQLNFVKKQALCGYSLIIDLIHPCPSRVKVLGLYNVETQSYNHSYICWTEAVCLISCFITILCCTAWSVKIHFAFTLVWSSVRTETDGRDALLPQ